MKAAFLHNMAAVRKISLLFGLLAIKIIEIRRVKILADIIYICGFGGLGVACWPLVPKFAGSNLAEAVGFLGRKNLQRAFLRRGSKAISPMS